MFDRYTEKARRVVFFAKHEATTLGAPYIETEHLLLGILREDTSLADQFFPTNGSVDSIRKQVEAHSTRRKRVPAGADRPLSDEAKRSLAYALEEADRLGDKHIGTEHLFLGVLRTERSFGAKLLNDLGVEIAPIPEPPPAKPVPVPAPARPAPVSARPAPVPVPAPAPAPQAAAKEPASAPARPAAAQPRPAPVPAAAPVPAPQPVAVKEPAPSKEAVAAKEPDRKPTPAPVPAPAPVAESMSGMLRDLTQAAKDGVFDPIVGRELEIDILIEVLCGTERRNPILVGNHGAGKSGIVQGLAQRIAAGQVPADLANKRIIEVDPEFLATWAAKRQRFDEFLGYVAAIADPAQTILHVNCFLRLNLSKTRDRSHDFAGFLQWTVTQPGLLCIAIAEDKEFPLAAPMNPWLVEDFREIRVRPLSEEATLVALQNRKPVLEKAHGVVYSEESLEAAMRAATRDMSGARLPRTALELLDTAGTMIKLRRGKPPVEVLELQKKIAKLAEEQKSAMKNREFDKARTLAEEERKEQENLKALQKKGKTKSSGPETIAPEDIKAVIARWSAYPYSQ